MGKCNLLEVVCFFGLNVELNVFLFEFMLRVLEGSWLSRKDELVCGMIVGWKFDVCERSEFYVVFRF